MKIQVEQLYALLSSVFQVLIYNYAIYSIIVSLCQRYKISKLRFLNINK